MKTGIICEDQLALDECARLYCPQRAQISCGMNHGLKEILQENIKAVITYKMKIKSLQGNIDIFFKAFGGGVHLFILYWGITG